MPRGPQNPDARAEKNEFLPDWQVSAFHDLSPVDQANYNALMQAGDIIQLTYDAGYRIGDPHWLTVDEMSGGSMSLSNLGGIGGTYFTPIVNWPEVAILGVSRGATEPVWKDGQFVPRQTLPLSLSYDHRLIDGADAIRFLRWVVEAIEQPFLLSLIG